MKILVCTDSSKQSTKAIAEAAKIAEGCRMDEVDIIHVYSVDLYVNDVHSTISQVEQYEIMQKFKKDEGVKILAEAAKMFSQTGAAVKTILKEGHPARSIINMASKGNYDMIIMGSRGLGGVKKALLGSVSYAVLQEVHTSVLIVK